METMNKYVVISGPDGGACQLVSGDAALAKTVLACLECVDTLDEAQPETQEIVREVIDPTSDWRGETPPSYNVSFEDGFLGVYIITDEIEN